MDKIIGGKTVMDMTRDAMEFIQELTNKAAPVHQPMEICGKTESGAAEGGDFDRPPGICDRLHT